MKKTLRKSAMMGAAATALIGAARSLYAGVSVEPATTTVQEAVKDALNGPKKFPASDAADSARLLAISIGNGDDITVGPDETAIAHQETVEDIDVVNTGNLTGGIGIEVSTGAIDLGQAVFDETLNYVNPGRYETLYDMDGNYVLTPEGWPASAATAEFSYTTRNTILTRDPLESAITISNGGSIDFTNRGISARNPSGDSITISNSGDITATEEVAGRVGIYANTESFSDTFDDTLTQAGQFVRNANGQLVEVIAPDQFDTYRQRIDMEYDGGAINIHNTGNIDMGAVTGPRLYGPSSVGILAVGDGGTTIVNDGRISVDRWSAAIEVVTTAGVSVTNNGRIDIGNGSSGIATGQSYGSAGDYRLGGDVNILNTGDIVGGITKDEAAPGEAVFSVGMHIFALGSNNEYLAGLAHLNETYAEYNELLGSDVYALIDIPNTRLYDTNVTNQGRIEMQDGGFGMYIQPRAGVSTAINEGTITVGDGTSIFEANNQQSSAGIFQSNFPFNGQGATVSINAESGIIVTGDDSGGLINLNWAGDSVAINEGSITTGDGVTKLITNYNGETYHRLFHSFGIESVSGAPMIGTSSYARNSGDITVGRLAIGSLVTGNSPAIVDAARITALNFNEGIIETGDNSSGLLSYGTNATTVNTGSITTGNYDISAFVPHPQFTADEFAQLRFGAASSGSRLSEVLNAGTITTGDGTIGASAHFNEGYSLGLASRVIQSEDGVITTGDHSIGARVASTYYALFGNDGRISTGDDSVGVDLTAGNVVLFYGQLEASILQGAIAASNNGIIETGDNSVGLRANGIREDLAYSGRVYVPNPNPPPYYDVVDVAGTADVTSFTYVQNSGVIRVGAQSTAVEITGLAANEAGLHIFNTGTIDASLAGSTALSLNAGHDIDSYAVNVGTMAGGITFGDGDDKLVNTLMIGDTGQVTHTGNLVLNNSTIDFGAGENIFDNDRGLITFSGANLITGADVTMTLGSIEARNGVIGDLLTIDGNLAGDFTFGADLRSTGSDRLAITGDVAEGSSIGLVLNPTEQLKGDMSVTVVTVGGENLADAPIIAGITGNFADSLQGAEIHFDEATGEIQVTATFGMGHMATSAVSATTMAQNWWMQAVGSFDKRNLQKLAGAEDTGVSVWAAAFHEEGTYEPGNELQDTSFDQKLSGLQTGVEWQKDVAGGSFTLGAMFSQGDASVNLNANVSSAVGSASAYGVNASYSFKNGLYLNAAWQNMSMDVNLRTPGTFSAATGSTQAEGDGFNVEMGYAHRFGSGLTLLPQLQYASVDVELDDFSSSDDVYGLSDVGGKHSLLRAGLSLLKTFETTNGSITPVLDLSWLDALDGDSSIRSNGLQFANDTSGSGLRAEFGIAGRYKAWDISGRVGLTDTQKSKQSLSTNLNVRYRW